MYASVLCISHNGDPLYKAPIQCNHITTHTKTPYKTLPQNPYNPPPHTNSSCRLAWARRGVFSLEAITMEHISTLSHWNILSQHTGYVTIYPPYQNTLATHPLNPPYPISPPLLTHTLSPCPPTLSTHPVHPPSHDV